jgi:CheY-like chemotaxis protein
MAPEVALITSQDAGILTSALPSLADERKDVAPQSIVNPHKEMSGKRIAIVDDEEDLTSTFTMLFTRLGFDIECIAQSGDEIVQAVKQGKHPDVIIMDYRMPGMNGLEASKTILEKMPSVKIVIASADDSIRQPALAAGLSFLPKPFLISSLERLLEELLNS